MMKILVLKEMHGLITRLLLLLLLIIIVDQVFRTRVIKSPSEIAEAYFQKVSMLTGGMVDGVEEEMSAKERAIYLARRCREGREGVENVGESLPFKGEVVDEERGVKDSKGGALFLMKAGAATKEREAGGGAGAGGELNIRQSDVLVCAPPHSAAKAVFEQINDQMGAPCKRGRGGKIVGCDPVDKDNKKNATLNILLTRHPFDRLIIEFRRSKGNLSSKKERKSKRSISLGNETNQNDANLKIGQNYNTRKTHFELPFGKNHSHYISKKDYVEENIVNNKNSKSNEVSKGARIRRRRSFARHRNILRGRGGGGRGQQFRQFIKSKVLSPEWPSVRPVTEVCGVCKRRWDQVVRLEDSNAQLQQVLQSLGGISGDKITKQGGNVKTGGRETQRKFFSQVTAEEIELLYIKFKEDFLLFGYSLDFYMS